MILRFTGFTLANFVFLATLLLLDACSGANPTRPPATRLAPTPTRGVLKPTQTPLPPTQVPPTEVKATAPPPATQTPAAKNSALAPGFNVAVPAAQGLEDHYGVSPSLALNATDDPMVAYLVQDPNNDGNNSESTLSFVRWDRANGRWTTPVIIDTVDDIYGFSPQIELARDASNNLLGIAYHRGDSDIYLALSTDNGATWKKEKVSSPDISQVDNPSLALANGNTFIAYIDDNGLEFLSRTGTSGEFKAIVAPDLPDTGGPMQTQPQVAVDSTGRPGIAYFISPGQDYNTSVAFWRPDETQVYKVTDSNNIQNDDAYISFGFAGIKPRIVVNLSRGEKSGGPMYLITSDDGKTWSAPVQIPRDGPNRATDGYLSLALDGDKGAAIAAPSTGGNQDQEHCGEPKLARSTDLQNWKTCSPDTDGTLNLDAAYSSLVFDGKGKLYLAFQNTTAGARVGPGLIVWREP